MLIWLLALLLLSVSIYVAYRFSMNDKKVENNEVDNHYTFKI